MYRLVNASIYRVSLSKDLCRLIVMCSGELDEVGAESIERKMDGHSMHGFHCLALDTSIFSKRKNELHQVALQASNIEDLNEVIRASISVMFKQWSDAMHTFHEKFDPLSSLIVDHGNYYLAVIPMEGTFGYLAPEYFMHGIVDEKTDVYAFGVLLL